MTASLNHHSRSAQSRRRLLAIVGGGCIAAMFGGELIARFGLGLGDPPLNDAYPDLEYAFRPGTYRRFGNIIRINSKHMRSEEFPDRKTSPDEFRVMLMGDSVVNGGALTDQADLASEVLQKELPERLGRPVVVGNISAGSWGPGNLLAYARRFGLFDADVVVVVLNSVDAGDNPTGRRIVGVDPSFPERRPWSAVWEGLARYVVPKIIPGGVSEAEPSPVASDSDPVARSMNDLDELCTLVASTGARVILAHFPNRAELAGTMLPGHAAIKALAEARGLQLMELAPALAAARAKRTDPYRPRDSIHPSAAGQQIMALALIPEILRQAKTSTVD
jgi:hypothetical protein